MTTLAFFRVHLVTVLLVTLLAGIIWRRRHSSCLSFMIYVMAVIASNLLIGLFPERFFNLDFYLLKEIVHNLLKFAVAIELAYRTVDAFPAAQRTLRVTLLPVLGLTLLLTMSVDPSLHENSYDLTGEQHARILNGTIWVLTAVAWLILWYRLPVDPFHKAILVGFVPYLLVFSVAMRVWVTQGHDVAQFLNEAQAWAYLALLVYWNHAAWRKDPVHSASPAELAARLRAPQTG